MKLEIKKKNEDKDMIVKKNMHFKLSKLIIARFKGKNFDSLRFWNQF